MTAPQWEQYCALGYKGWPHRGQLVTLMLAFAHPLATAPSAVIFSRSVTATPAARKNGESLPGRMQMSWASVSLPPMCRNYTGRVV